MPATLARPQRPWALRLLPPFPHVASRVIALADEDEVTKKEIGDIIRLDPSFTAEILRVANSARFGVSREITTVSSAITRLGLDRVKACATLLALNSMVKPALRIDALRKCWMHCLVSAMVTEEIARVCGRSAGTAYTVGLLHDLGTLGLMAAYPDEYNRMLEVTQDCGFDLIRTEYDLFEIDHCAAGAYLAEEWNFPEEIGLAIASHHQEPEAKDHSLAGMVRIGWRLADVLGYAAFPPDRPWTFEELIAMVPEAHRSWLGAGLEEAQQEIASLLSDFPF